MRLSSRNTHTTRSKAGKKVHHSPRHPPVSHRAKGERAWLVAGLVIYLAVAVTGVYVSLSSQQMRNLFTSLQRIQVQNDELLGEYSRLLLERGAFASYLNVDRVAEQDLSMKFPELRDEVRRVKR